MNIWVMKIYFRWTNPSATDQWWKSFSDEGLGFSWNVRGVIPLFPGGMKAQIGGDSFSWAGIKITAFYSPFSDIILERVLGTSL